MHDHLEPVAHPDCVKQAQRAQYVDVAVVAPGLEDRSRAGAGAEVEALVRQVERGAQVEAKRARVLQTCHCAELNARPVWRVPRQLEVLQLDRALETVHARQRQLLREPQPVCGRERERGHGEVRAGQVPAA